MYNYLLNTPIPEEELEIIDLFYQQSFFKNGYIWESQNHYYYFKNLKQFPKETILLNTLYFGRYNLTFAQFTWPGCQNFMWSKVDFFWIVGKLPDRFKTGCSIGGSFCEIISRKRQMSHFFVRGIEFLGENLLLK